MSGVAIPKKLVVTGVRVTVDGVDMPFFITDWSVLDGTELRRPRLICSIPADEVVVEVEQ
jgi:hypothetical protein